MLSLGRDNALVALVQDVLPRSIVVSRTDARLQLDQELKRVCEEILSTAVRDITETASSLTARATAFLVSRPSEASGPNSLTEQAFMKPGICVFPSFFGACIAERKGPP